MTKTITLLICLLLTIGSFAFSRSDQSALAHDQWLQERYFEATSVKEGMTRADLIKIFRIDGGLQSFLPTRYVLKSSSMIKVEVEFDVLEGTEGKTIPEDLRFEMESTEVEVEMESTADNSEGKPLPKDNYQYVPNERLKIKSISRPYIEQFNYD